MAGDFEDDCGGENDGGGKAGEGDEELAAGEAVDCDVDLAGLGFGLVHSFDYSAVAFSLFVR